MRGTGAGARKNTRKNMRYGRTRTDEEAREKRKKRRKKKPRSRRTKNKPRRRRRLHLHYTREAAMEKREEANQSVFGVERKVKRGENARSSDASAGHTHAV